MTWNQQWKALDGRLAGLLEAGHLVMRSMQVQPRDNNDVGSRISRHAGELANELAAFRETYQTSLPPRALDELRRFVEDDKPLLDKKTSGFNGLQLSITLLASFRAALNYHLTDFDTVACRRSERAFLHLQQLIVADTDQREKWMQAFDAHETHCERLGGAHLLMHGIWAFKVGGAGAATDLVFGEPVTDASGVERVADALVLTEWKRVQDPTKADSMAEQARTQAFRYGTGILGGIELATYRYIVLVSKDRLVEPRDEQRDGITYRHVNIAVDPSKASKVP